MNVDQYVDRLSEFNLFKRDNFTCIYCGKSPIEDGIKLHIEHIDPILIGGLTEIDNLVTACGKCNLAKSASALPNGVRLRILHVVLKRNKALSIHHYGLIERQILELQNKHKHRVSSLRILNQK